MTINFILNYPCYAPMQTTEEPFTFTVDDHQCIAILTDADLLNRFFKGQKATGKLLRMTLDSPESLAMFLEEHSQRQKNGIPITHVLIDPVDPGRPARCYPILEFVQHVLKQG